MFRALALIIGGLIVPSLSAAQSVARISVWPDGSALPLSGGYQPMIDPNGRFVLFVGQDFWLKDLETGAADRIAVPSNLRAVSLSSDGRQLILVADGYAIPPDASRLNLLNLESRVIVPVPPPRQIAALEPAQTGTMSADLQWSVYSTQQGLFLHDRVEGRATQIVPEPVYSVSVSANGGRVLFHRPGVRLDPAQLVVYDRASGTLERVDVGAPNLEGGSVIFASRISGDGRFAVFEAVCVNTCGDSVLRIFMRDLEWRRTWELVQDIDGKRLGRSDVQLRQVSQDGRFILFESANNNLVPGDSGANDLFVIDRITRRIVRVNDEQRGIGTALLASMSTGGLRVAFANAPSLVRLPAPSSPLASPPVFLSSLDGDRDGMQDDWERFVGLSPANASDGREDADYDGLSNLDEFRVGSQPRARFQLRTRETNVDPEHARLVLRNRGDTPASVWLRLVDASGLSSGYSVSVEPRSTLVLPVPDIPDRPRQPFLLQVTTDVVIYPSLSQ